MNWIIIIIFILSISFFLITKYYYLKKTLENENLEAFETEIALTPTQKLLNTHGLTIKYLTSQQARKLIVKNGEYLQGMNQANLSARGCTSLDDLYNKYINAFDDITPDEQKNIDKFILDLLNNVKQYNSSYYNYIVKWLSIISFAKAKSWLEGGMPHTLDNTIVMDASWFTNPRKTTLLHEITHVHQRNTPLDYEDLYPSLGYLYNPEDIRGMDSIYPLNRNNPDGTSKYWLWGNGNTYWWIGAIFTTVNPDKLTDINMVALTLDRDKEGNFYYLKQNPTPLSNLKEFILFFGENPNNYHPNEMTAKFAEWYLEDILRVKNSNRTEYNKYEGYKIYKKYFENMINNYY